MTYPKMMLTMMGVIVAFLMQLACLDAMRVSQVPFKYNVFARDWRNKTKLVEGRTDRNFFQRIFRIRPFGDPSLNYDTWMELKNSPLFTNLTLEVIADKYGDLQFVVTGIESPSRTFSPEVALSSSRFGEPQISGGLQLTDNHFRGKGETLQVSVTLPEDSVLITARPDLRIIWTDNHIGKSSRVSLGYQQVKDESSFKEFVAQRGTPDRLLSKEEFAEKKNQFSTLSRKVYATLSRTWLPKNNTRGKFSTSMEPYVSEDRLMPKESPNAFFASITSGIKSTFEWKPSSGTGSLQLEYDAGATSSPRGRAKFHVVEMVGKVNYPVASSLFYIANPLKGLIGCLRKKPVVVSTIVPSEGTVGLVSDAGIQSVESSGTVADTTGQFVASTQQRIKFAVGRGCNDLHHFSDLTRSRIVRRPALTFGTFLPPPEPVAEPVPKPNPVPTPVPKKNWWGGYSKDTTSTIESSMASPTTTKTSSDLPPPPAPTVAAPVGSPFIQNLASYYLAYKTDLGYKKPTWWGTPGAFFDIAHSYHPLPPSAPYGSDIYALSAGAGLSLRFKGVRVELAWPVFMKQLGQQAPSVKPALSWLNAMKPSAYLGFDFEN